MHTRVFSHSINQMHKSKAYAYAYRGMVANLAQELRRRIAENARVLAGRVEEDA